MLSRDYAQARELACATDSTMIKREREGGEEALFYFCSDRILPVQSESCKTGQWIINSSEFFQYATLWYVIKL